jgi:hypothetical protein
MREPCGYQDAWPERWAPSQARVRPARPHDVLLIFDQAKGDEYRPEPNIAPSASGLGRGSTSRWALSRAADNRTESTLPNPMALGFPRVAQPFLASARRRYFRKLYSRPYVICVGVPAVFCREDEQRDERGNRCPSGGGW